MIMSSLTFDKARVILLSTIEGTICRPPQNFYKYERQCKTRPQCAA